MYAELPAARVRQLLGDALVLAWAGLWVWAGIALHGLVLALAAPGQRLKGAGQGLAEGLDRAGRSVGELPFAGDVLTAPFRALRDAARGLEAAGQVQQDAVARLGLWLAVLVAVLPVGAALIWWLPHRLRWARDVRAVSRLRAAPGGLDLLAWRALASRPLSTLARAGVADPVAALRAADPTATARLAAIELTALGLRVSAPKRR